MCGGGGGGAEGGGRSGAGTGAATSLWLASHRPLYSLGTSETLLFGLLGRSLAHKCII